MGKFIPQSFATRNCSAWAPINTRSTCRDFKRSSNRLALNRNYSINLGGHRRAFIAIEANAGMAVLTEGILPMLPAALTMRRFSPELAPLLIAAAMPILRPNPHSEAFLKSF